MKAKAFVIKQISNNDNEVIVETDKEVGRFGRYVGIIRLPTTSKPITTNW